MVRAWVLIFDLGFEPTSPHYSKEMLTTVTHAVVLSRSANRQFNLSRRELLRPHLNKNHQALCNPTVPITTNVFGEDLNKHVDH